MKASGKDWGESLLTGLQVYGGGSLGAGIGQAGAATAPTTELASQTAGQAAAAGGAGAGTAAGTAAETAAAQTAAQTAGTAAGTATPEMITAPLEGANAVAGTPLQTVPMDAPVDTFANVNQPSSGFGWDEGFNPTTGQLESGTAERLANLPGTPQTVTTPFDTTKALTNDQLAAGNTAYMDKAGTMGERASDFGRGVKGLMDPSNKAVTFGNTLGNMSTPAQIGVGTGIAGAFVDEPEETTPDKPKPVYYIKDPKTGKSLYQQGTVNPNVAKLGYVPQGESYFQGQQFNPGVYSYSYDKYDPVPGMRSGGNVGIARYAGGGAMSQDTAKNIVANSGTAIQPSQPSPNQMAMQSANQYFQNQAANAPSGPMIQAAPSSQAMNDYLAQGNQMITPVERSASNQGLEGEGTDTRLSNLQTASNKYDFEREILDNPGIFRTRDRIRKEAGLPYAENGKIVYPSGDGDYWAEGGTDKYNDAYTNAVAARAKKFASYAAGGLANLGGTYAAGGKLLRGAGDGMSDSIPAVIGGKKPQRAALADGEFVVPADVVSHLGNGSTEAGSRKLYAMMDKIRHARTGRKKQAPAIKAERFMPR
jgi:hypothetical protein